MLSKVRVFIVFLAVVTVLLYFNKNFLNSRLGSLTGFSKDFFSNFTSEFKLERSRPLSTLEREEKLKQFLPNVFGDFSEDDWNDFWKLIYGTFPEQNSANKLLPKKYRQLTLEEIEERLIDYYPDNFGRLGPEHWDYFWRGILKLK